MRDDKCEGAVCERVGTESECREGKGKETGECLVNVSLDIITVVIW